jgi:amidophosphoribosyltransferase
MNSNFSNNNIEIDKVNHECGVFGIYDLDGEDVSSSIYYGLYGLQHRGQEGCGIAVSDTNGPLGDIRSHKGMGLMSEVFTEESLEDLSGNIGVGHVRYATGRDRAIANVQPLVLHYAKGTLCLGLNGTLLNHEELKHELAHTGAIFQTSIDTEIIAYVIARERLKTSSIEEAVKSTMKKIVGAYSIVMMSPRKLIGIRDPYGVHPLVIGKRDNAYVIASETSALDAIGAEIIRDVEPGEIISIDKNGLHSDKSLVQEKKARCIFEYIYFARADSKMDDVSVYQARIMAGKLLAKAHPVEADLVVGVPDSGKAAAVGYAQESGIPYGTAFIKNSYVGRTFIKPKQSMRETSVRIKLNVLKEMVEGKRIVMIDDSIVRGTTSGIIVKALKDAGATEVHVRISSPPFLHPCYYGTDVPSGDQLIAHNNSIEEIREIIGADSLGYLDISDLSSIIGGQTGYCDACFTGNYPIKISDNMNQ